MRGVFYPVAEVSKCVSIGIEVTLRFWLKWRASFMQLDVLYTKQSTVAGLWMGLGKQLGGKLPFPGQRGHVAHDLMAEAGSPSSALVHWLTSLGVMA